MSKMSQAYALTLEEAASKLLAALKGIVEIGEGYQNQSVLHDEEIIVSMKAIARDAIALVEGSNNEVETEQ